jgi:hypothetical protein
MVTDLVMRAAKEPTAAGTRRLTAVPAKPAKKAPGVRDP